MTLEVSVQVQNDVSQSKSQDYIDRTFGPGGFLSKVKPGYVPRPTQIEFARAVDKALREGTPLLGQAPCGCGKGLSYLVPAIYHAVAKKKRVIIATATNSLLDQLSKGKDCELAMLQRALPVKFTYATLKGKANYLCLKKMEGFEPELQVETQKESARKLLVWGQNTDSGDRGEAPEGEAKALWWKVSCGPEDCTKPACLYGKKDPDMRMGGEYCFAEAAKDRAKGVQIIVTNIHYLITHLKYGETALPDAEYFIIDEGHELPDIARDFWGGEERPKDFDTIVAYAYMMERSKMLPAGTGERIRKQVNDLFDHLRDSTLDPVKTALKRQQDWSRKKLIETLTFDLKPLKDDLKACAKLAKIALDEGEKKGHEDPEEADAQKFKNHLLKVWEMITSLESTEGDLARWVEVNGDDVCVKFAPIEVGHILREYLFKKHPATVLASATLSTGGDFSFIRRETGLDRDLKLEDRTVSVRELDVPSPFNHQEQCLFMVPRGAVDPSDYEPWMQSVFKTVRRVVELCDGRTLGLFTSKRAMEQMATWLRQLMPRRTILVQGDYAPREISKRFKDEHASVLLGTRSFWTGLDVPGESLSAVVIDKLPVPQQEPLMLALKNKMGGSYFDRYLFPKASITFQQGCGRVIRSVTDVGVIVLCDPRIYTKNYGHHFTKSLPAMTRSDDLEQIPKFLAKAKRR